MQSLMDDFSEVQKRTGIYGCCVAKLFSRQLIQGIFFDEGLKLAEDFDFYLKVYRRVKSIYIDNYCGYYYRQNAQGGTSTIEDSRIDYVSQLKVNLRYKVFLEETGFFEKKNKAIVEKQISDYVYYSLIHCPEELLASRIKELQEICRGEHLIKGQKHFRNWLLKNMEKVRDGTVIRSVKSFHFIRKIVRKIKRV